MLGFSLMVGKVSATWEFRSGQQGEPRSFCFCLCFLCFGKQIKLICTLHSNFSVMVGSCIPSVITQLAREQYLVTIHQDNG